MTCRHSGVASRLSSSARWPGVYWLRSTVFVTGGTAQLTTLVGLSSSEGPDGWRFLLEMRMPERPVKLFGCPARLTLEADLPNDRPELTMTLQWFGKAACRLPEASWFSICPKAPDRDGWRLRPDGTGLQCLREGDSAEVVWDASIASAAWAWD